MSNDFVDQFSGNTSFTYSCFDRVILKGYILNMFFPGQVIGFLRSLGFRTWSDNVLRLFTDQLNTHITKEAEKHGVPVIWWPSVNGGTNGAKLEYVNKHYANKYDGRGNFTYCIITDRETVSTFASRKVTSKTGKQCNKLYKTRKQVKQYYIYFHDHLLGGPCYLKISSYFPFESEFYFNGHNTIRLALDRENLQYRMQDNAFTFVEEPEKLNSLASKVTGLDVEARIKYWISRYFKFHKGTYSTCSKYLEHDWYCRQVEVCSNVIFKSSRYCRNIFDRLLEKNSSIGLPDSLSQIFTSRPHRPESRRTVRLFDNNACMKHWFRGNSIKQYNKGGFIIRTETTINNPKSLRHKLKKPAVYLQGYLWFGIGCNDRYLNCCADIDISSLSADESDFHSKPVLDKNNHKVAAIDLRKDRQVILLKELLKPKYAVFGFKTAELQSRLKSEFSNSAKIRYELKKLIARGVVSKKKGQSFYTVTKAGIKWIWVSICSLTHFVNPLISKSYKNNFYCLESQPSKIEEAFQHINDGLTQLTQELCLSA